MTSEIQNLPAHADSAIVSGMHAILSAYPALTDDQIDSAVTFLRNGPILERGLLLSRPGMAEQAALIREQHKHRFGKTPGEWLAVAAIVTLLVVVTLLLWDYGA